MERAIREHEAAPAPPLAPGAATLENSLPSPGAVLEPLRPLTTAGEFKKRASYNYYYQYPAEFFVALFHLIAGDRVLIVDAARWLCIAPSTLSSKYNLWKSDGENGNGVRDRRGRPRLLTARDKKMIKDELDERMERGAVTQNRPSPIPWA